MPNWRRSSPALTTPEFSLRVKQVFRECVEVIYTEAAGEFRFAGERAGQDWQQINISVPTNISEQDIHRILPKLSSGLTRLGHPYVIYQRGEPQPISAAEQTAAVSQLREWGYEPVILGDGVVTLNKLPNVVLPEPAAANERNRMLMRLVATVAGKRFAVKILASSDSAHAEFG